MKERGSEGAKVSVLGRARENDNFLALLLNKSVSIATIQPATGEREQEGERKRRESEREREGGGKRGCTGEIEGRIERERVTIATEEEGEKELEETLKKHVGRKGRRRDMQKKSEFTADSAG